MSLSRSNKTIGRKPVELTFEKKILGKISSAILAFLGCLHDIIITISKPIQLTFENLYPPKSTWRNLSLKTLSKVVSLLIVLLYLKTKKRTFENFYQPLEKKKALIEGIVTSQLAPHCAISKD